MLEKTLRLTSLGVPISASSNSFEGVVKLGGFNAFRATRSGDGDGHVDGPGGQAVGDRHQEEVLAEGGGAADLHRDLHGRPLPSRDGREVTVGENEMLDRDQLMDSESEKVMLRGLDVDAGHLRAGTGRTTSPQVIEVAVAGDETEKEGTIESLT